jgi:hypothetical protein
MAWCKLESTFKGDPKFGRLSDALGLTEQLGRRRGAVLAKGCIASLWSWASDHAPDGDLGDYEDAEIEEAADWDGEPGAFVEACAQKRIGLLDKSRYGYSIHGYLARAESHKAAQRKRKQREREREEQDRLQRHGDVTPASRDGHNNEDVTVTPSRDGHENVTGERESEREREKEMAPGGAVGGDDFRPKEFRKDRFGEQFGAAAWRQREQREGLPGLPLNEKELGMLAVGMNACREAGVPFADALDEWFRPEWKAAFGWSVDQFAKRIRAVLNAISDPTLRPGGARSANEPAAKPGRPVPTNDLDAEMRAKQAAWEREQAEHARKGSNAAP